jgi:ribonuclease HI
MLERFLFTDSSVNPQTKVGYGAYLVVAEPNLGWDELKSRVKLRRFDQTSSTRLELQTLLWALGEIQLSGPRLKIFTDSQNTIGLPDRRDQLERNDYRSVQGKILINHELYREFYRLTDQLDCGLIKVRGHQLSKQKSDIEELFTLVDRASRKALREESR